MLEIHDLHSGYGRIPILNGISFALAEGEIVGVLGHNGMGKTTLLRTLVGQVRISRGRVVFDGRDITRRGIHQRARAGLGYVPQGRQIFPQLSVMENIKIAALGLRNNKTAISDVLDYFPVLQTLLDRQGQALSGGEQQILALARCLVRRPKVVLLDEPTEGIQPSIVDQISEKLGELAKALGLTVLLVEQDLHFIASLSSRVLIIQKGSIIAEIAPESLNDKEIVDEYLGI